MYQRVINKELSAHAAAKQMGIRYHYVSVRMDDSISACATITKNMDPQLIQDLVRRLQETLDDRSVSL